MSLINNSLKRAMTERRKGAGMPTTPAPAPRPMPRPASARKMSHYILPACVALSLIVAGILLWKGISGTTDEMKVRAESKMNEAQTAPVPSPVAAGSAAPAATTNTPTPEAALPGQPSAAPPAAVELPKTETVTYHLQSIFYRARGASAVINGKTIFVGDHVEGARVVAIAKDCVTIVTPAGRTNILDLD